MILTTVMLIDVTVMWWHSNHCIQELITPIYTQELITPKSLPYPMPSLIVTRVDEVTVLMISYKLCCGILFTLSSCLSVCPSVRLLFSSQYICVILQDVRLSICPLLNFGVKVVIRLSVCLSVRPSVHPSVRPSVCLSVCLSSPSHHHPHPHPPIPNWSVHPVVCLSGHIIIQLCCEVIRSTRPPEGSQQPPCHQPHWWLPKGGLVDCITLLHSFIFILWCQNCKIQSIFTHGFDIA